MREKPRWLQGLSPRENRDVPPLDYPLVYELKQAFPKTPIAINGGVESIAAVREHLDHVDGVMLGRAAYHNPELLLRVDPRNLRRAGAGGGRPCGRGGLHALYRGAASQGVRLANITRHMLGLFAGRPGARAFRRKLATDAVKPGAGVDVLRAAVAEVDRACAENRGMSGEALDPAQEARASAPRSTARA